MVDPQVPESSRSTAIVLPVGNVSGLQVAPNIVASLLTTQLYNIMYNNSAYNYPRYQNLGPIGITVSVIDRELAGNNMLYCNNHIRIDNVYDRFGIL